MKTKSLFVLVFALLFAALAPAQMVQVNYNGVGQMYAGNPGQTEIGWLSPGYTAGVAQSAGKIGEVISSVVPSGSAVSVTTATPVNITTITLTPGDWQVSWTAYIQPAAGTAVTILQAGLGTTTATLPLLTSTSPLAFASWVQASATPGSGTIPLTLTSGVVQINISVSTTYYLVTSDTFSASTLTAYGWAAARRIR